MKKTIIFLSAVLLLGLVSFTDGYSQFSKAGPQLEVFYSTIDGSEQPYTLFLPLDFDAGKTYPLVIMLHGAWANHYSAIYDVLGKGRLPAGSNLVDSYRFYTDYNDLQYIVACPYARGTMGYQGIPEDDVMRVIEECRKNFRIDENRIYLTGLSMGGGGTLYISLTRPDLFAAIAPVCPAPPPDAYDLIGNAMNLPISLHQGGADPVVKPEGVRLMVDDLQKAGALIEYTEYPEIGHDVWTNAYRNGLIFNYFDKQVRNPFPDKVHFTSKWYKYNTAYWVIFDRISPGTLATIDAQFKNENQIEIKTSNLEGFTLKLKGHQKFVFNKPLIVSINGSAITSLPKDNHSFCLENGKWTAGKYVPPVSHKHKGLEGPLASAIYDRHVYIYGTADDPGQEELQRRIDIATKAADFRGGFARANEPVTVNPRVMSDKQYRPEYMGNVNMVLFGTKKTNAVIAGYADKLPVELSDDAQDYGLVYCFPAGGNLIVVSSGIPFWVEKPPEPRLPSSEAAAAPAVPSRPSANFMAGNGARALVNFKDLLLFRETNDNRIADCYFNQDWQLPAEEVKKLKESGVIIFNSSENK